MEKYIAFLRGINVGGNTLLPMKELAALCTDSGLKEVRTYINSGNVLFKSALPEEKIKIKLEKALEKKMAKPISVVVRTVQNIENIVLDNPFPNSQPSKVGVLLLSDTVSKKIKDEFVNVAHEEIVVRKQEIYIHFPDGMGVSKLKWPVQLKNGTVRNINTLTKVVALAHI